MKLLALPAVMILMVQPLWAADCRQGISVIVEGEVVTRAEYGPPNWGEDPAHDSKWTMGVLILSPASQKEVYDFASACAVPPTKANEVQVWGAKGGEDWGKLRHLKVRIAGLLRVQGGAPAEILPLQLQAVHLAHLY